MDINGFQTRSVGNRPERSRMRLPGKRSLPGSLRAGGGLLGKLRGKVRGKRVGDWLEYLRPSNLWENRWKIIKWGGGALVVYLLFLWLTLPDIRDPGVLMPVQSTVITDRNGTELYRLYSEQNRTPIPADKIPDSVKKAVVAIEDQRFYDRGCLDMRAIARVFFRFGQAGGASTITRQLARNALNLQKDWIINRKVKEIVLGCQLERRYSKDELLALYLNWIPFGQNAYGIEQASQAYFGKSASGLTLAESSVLASLPQRPSYFSPQGSHLHTSVSERINADIISGRITKVSDISDDEISIGLLGGNVGTGSTTLYIGGRTDQVLRNMQDQGFIQDEDRLTALEDLETITFKKARQDIRAPHFVLWVRDQVEEILAGTADEDLLEQGGLTIQTTLDWKLQEIAEGIMEKKKDGLPTAFGAYNAALVSVDTQTREVMAYVGNADYNDEEHGGKIDMARVPRQPGSSFKPFVYAAAFENGYSPATVIHDVPTKIGAEEPQNFDGGFWGIMSIRRALGASRNIPAIKAYFLAGQEDSILDLVYRLGATTPRDMREQLREERGQFDYGWPLAIGAGETPLVEMVHAFSSMADNGQYKPLVSIRKITNDDGAILYEETPEQTGEKVLDPRVAYEVTSILSDVSARPDAFWQAALTVPGTAAAAKTGTSNKCLERSPDGTRCLKRKPDNLWTMGYTPELVTGVWVGNASSDPLFDRADGLNAAAPIWKEFMTKATATLPSPQKAFVQPSGMVQVQVSALSGELPAECTPIAARVTDIFLQENAPSKADPACTSVLVDKVTSLLASPSCPPDAQEQQSFYVPYSVAAGDFPAWDAGVKAWAAGKSVTGSGTGLPLPVVPTKECDPSLTPGRLIQPEVTLLFPGDDADTSASYPSFKPRIRYEVGSTVREVRYVLDGKDVAVENQAPFEPAIRVQRSVQEAGPHTLEVILTDEYYNKATDKVTFRFADDSEGPDLQITEPGDGDTFSQSDSISFEVEAVDREGGIKYVEFYLDDTLLTSKPREPYTLIYPLKDVPPGRHELRVVAEDYAENKGQDRIVIEVEE